MVQDRQKFYLELLKSEISPALGCTEPAAAALGAAYAAKELGMVPEKIEVSVSQYIFKNGMNVGIPGTGMTGLDIAVALGAVSANPQKELLVLEDLTREQKAKAKEMILAKKIHIGIAELSEKVYVKVDVTAGDNKASAVISRNHKNLTLLMKNDRVIYKEEADKLESVKNACAGNDEVYDITLWEIVAFAESLPAEQLEFLKEVIVLNKGIALEGLENEYGLKVGRSILENNKSGLIATDVANYAVAMTAAAADARMAGCNKPVMSTAGSGNQGLTATIPIVSIGYKLAITEEKILRGLAISILLTVHTKHYLGRLSVLCGCSISAAMGVSCGIIYMLGGDYRQMQYAVNSMVADISGVVCDGAKPGCALKIATAVTSAIRAANMALSGTGADSHDGIVHKEVERTLENLGILGNKGMIDTNKTILNIMLENQRKVTE